MASSRVGVMAGDKAHLVEMVPALAEKPASLFQGKYTLVGWDMDTTGRRLIDEICQIAAYTPEHTYTQYIMPYGDLNPGARRRHNVRVVTVGRYRMLKDTNTHKILKTKSEISALSEFLDWLERVKERESSVILIYHEPRRLSPIMLLEAVIRYNLLDRFKSIVAGFTDNYALSSEKCKSAMKSVSLRVLVRVLLNSDTLAVNSALDRATAAYKIIEHFSQGDLYISAYCRLLLNTFSSGRASPKERQPSRSWAARIHPLPATFFKSSSDEQLEVGAGGEGASAITDMIDLARQWARPVHTELEVLADLKNLLFRQNTFRPVFAPLLRASRSERKHYTNLRRKLADAGLLYDQIKDAWLNNQLTGLENLLTPMTVCAKEEEIKELIEIFDCHFDPNKEAKVPRPKMKRSQIIVQDVSGSSSSSDSQDSSPHNSPSKNNSGLGDASGGSTSAEPATAN